MWTYSQSNGELTRNGCAWRGYSGHGEGKNNPDKQEMRGIGPIPRGNWSIVGPPQDYGTHGPYVMRLEPLPGTETFGRAGFLIHGDAVRDPGNGSLGCIVLPRVVREAIWTSGDHGLVVVE